MKGGCSETLVSARRGNLGGEISRRKLVWWTMDLRKLQIIFYTKGFERGASEPFVIGHLWLMSVIDWWFPAAPWRFTGRMNPDPDRQMHLHICRKELFTC